MFKPISLSVSLSRGFILCLIITLDSPFLIASNTSLTFFTVSSLKFGFSSGIPTPSFEASNTIVSPPLNLPASSASIIWYAASLTFFIAEVRTTD